jgi:hypothetical protein
MLLLGLFLVATQATPQRGTPLSTWCRVERAEARVTVVGASNLLRPSGVWVELVGSADLVQEALGTTHVSWTNTASAAVHGPTRLSWNASEPEGAPRLELDLFRAAQIEARGELRLDLPGGWRVDLRSVLVWIEATPQGTLRIANLAGSEPDIWRAGARVCSLAEGRSLDLRFDPEPVRLEPARFGAGAWPSFVWPWRTHSAPAAPTTSPPSPDPLAQRSSTRDDRIEVVQAASARSTSEPAAAAGADEPRPMQVSAAELPPEAYSPQRARRLGPWSCLHFAARCLTALGLEPLLGAKARRSGVHVAPAQADDRPLELTRFGARRSPR